MRNRKFIYAALALLTLGFAACQQEEDFVPQEQEINLNITAGGVQTRVNPLGTGDLWENGDNLIVAICGEATVSHKLTANVTNNGTIWTSVKKIYWGEDRDLKSMPLIPIRKTQHISVCLQRRTH